jgi:predicted phage terminase large subunit-like protein
LIRLDAHAMEGFVELFLLERFHESAPIAACHREWWDLICQDDPWIAFAAPRGHAKSTAVNHAYGLAAALFKVHPFQLKVSKTYALACEKVEQAKQELLGNEKIKGIFRLDEIERDRENDFIVRMNDGYRFRMMALGMGQATRGLSWGTMRPSLILGDDMEDDEEVLNRDRRDKGMKWVLNTLLPMGGDKTKIRIFGTILHNDSILMRLIKMGSWKSKIWEACDAEITQESILWPQKFSQKLLQDIRQNYVDGGNMAGFNMEYRNIAIDTSYGFFRPEDFRPMTPEDESRKFTYYVGMDFAISTKEGRDYTVMVVAAIDTEGLLYIVDVVKGRWDGNQIIDEMLAIERAYRPEEWYIEDGAIRKALGPALEMRMREEEEGKGLYMNLCPMVPTKDKVTRARSIQARVRAKAVKFHKAASWFPDFEQELIQFPRGDHDDQVDALAWIGLGLARMSTPITKQEEEVMEWEKEKRQTLTLGRSSVTGY